MKYIIKNCDNYTNFDEDWTCRSTIQNRKGCFCCKDITDCLLKQIVNECRNELEKRDAYSISIHYDFAREILKFIEIEEAE